MSRHFLCPAISVVLRRVAFRDAAIHRAPRPFDLPPLAGAALREHRQEDDPAPGGDVVAHANLIIPQVEPEFPQFSRELPRVRLPQVDTVAGEAVDVTVHGGALGAIQAEVPRVEFRLSLDLAPVHTTDAIIPRM